ncbi:oligomeric Golgi complex subunit 6 [Hyaloraphidium curvatum]|nr:oligomeric Golgi complex subunit 6 [Hyaloraphidium curvatum]
MADVVGLGDPAPPVLSSARAGAQNPLQRKMDKVLALQLDEPDTQAALHALADVFPAENSLAARRNLRGDVEKRELAISRKFLDALDAVNQKLVLVEQELQGMASLCGDMDRKLENATKRTSHLIKQTSSLKTQSTRANMKKAVAERFLERFTLTDAEVATLTGPLSFSAKDYGMSTEFFDALDRVHSIGEDCRALLTTEHQTAGVEIMDLMSGFQEKAFEKLHRWTQTECRTLGRDTAEATPTLRRAFRALRQRPLLFRSAVDDVVAVRRSAIVRQFIDALTRGGPGGTPRPIELHAHDPVRYVGDMLAWLHQAAAGEREMLEQIFDVGRSARELGPASPVLAGGEEFPPLDGLSLDQETILELLDKDLEGTCRPLKIRVEQVLSSQPNATTTYKVANVIQFYCVTIRKILGPRAQLTVVLLDLLDMGNRVFFDVLNIQASKMLRIVPKPERDLQPPAPVKDAVNQFKEIMASYDSSLTSADEREADFARIVGAALDPIVQLCNFAAAEISPLEKAIFMINCLNFIQSALVLYTFTSSRVQWIESQIEEYADQLVQHEYRSMLVHSGLGGIIQTMDSNTSNIPLALLPNMDHKTISDTMSRLDAYLCSASFDGSPALMKMTSSRIARTISRRAVDMFVEAYRRWHAAARDPKNKYEYPETMITRSVEEVVTLVGVDNPQNGVDPYG